MSNTLYARLRAQVPIQIKARALELASQQSDPTPENVGSLTEMWEITLLKKLDMVDLYTSLKSAWIKRG